MTALLAPPPKLRFVDSNGNALAGGLLFSYAAGTTTKQATYTDSTGLTPNPNPIVLDARGECSVWLAPGQFYKFVLSPATDTDPPTAPIWTADNIDGINDPVLATALAASSGSSLIGFISAGVGAVLRTLQAVLRGKVRIRDFGAVCDGTTDDTAAIQAAIVYAAQAFPSNSWLDPAYKLLTKNSPRVVDFEGSTCKVNGKLLVPSGVELRGDQSTLIGTGNTSSDNVCFESAYFSSGTITTNIGTTVGTQRLQATRIRGFRLMNFKLGANLLNFNEGCALEDIEFSTCYQNLVADNCYYARFVNLSSRDSATLAASTLAAFNFKNFVNVQDIGPIMVTNRVLAYQFDGAVNGLQLRNLSAENGTNGVTFTGEVNPLEVTACYFESLTGYALDFTTASAHREVEIHNNWFNNITGYAIQGVQMVGGKIGPNYFFNTPNKISVPDNTSTITVEVLPMTMSDSGSTVPTAPSGYTLATTCRVVFPQVISSSADGSAQARAVTTYDGYAELPWFGRSGRQVGAVAWCSSSSTGGTTFSVVVKSKIVIDSYVPYVFSLKFTDNVGTYQVDGWGTGTRVYAGSFAGKTVGAADDGTGHLQLTVGTFSHPAGTYSLEGIVRMM